MSEATITHAQRRRRLVEHSLFQLTLVRFLEFIREPESVFWVFVFPLLLAAGLGIAFRNRPAEVLPVGAISQDVAAALSRESQLSVLLLSPEEAERQLRAGRLALIVRRAPDGSVIFEYDDTNPDGRVARLLADDAVQRAAGRKDPVARSDLRVREPGSRYIDFLIPGLLGMNLMGSGIWGIGFAIVDARRKKLLKRLIASPMPRYQYLLSFLLSRLAILVVEVGALVGFGVAAFGVPVRGSLASLALLCVTGSLTFTALGLLIACRAQTIEAASGWMNVVMMPMWILSGVFFSADRFPAAFQPAIQALPLTAVIDALRAHMLEGTALAQLAPELGVMTFWMVACFALALKFFRWK